MPAARADTWQSEQQAWKIQRVGWAALLVFLGAAAAGVFGSGPLSPTEVSSEGGALTVEYQRFVRHRSPNEIAVRIAPRAWPNDVVRLEVPAAFFEKGGLDRVMPAPRAVVKDGER